MDEARFKPVAKNFLKTLGFRVNEVPPGDHAWIPHFEVIGKKDKYTLLFRTKGDDPREIKESLAPLPKGKPVNRRIPIGPPNRLARFIRKGVQQMMEHNLDGETFRVMWLHCSGVDPRSLFRRFHSALYGAEKIFSLKISDLIICYYFRESAFSSWRNFLDGVILTYENEAQLCVNTLSPRVEKFRKSELTVHMSK
jgi:hypothetical protein